MSQTCFHWFLDQFTRVIYCFVMAVDDCLSEVCVGNTKLTTATDTEWFDTTADDTAFASLDLDFMEVPSEEPLDLPANLDQASVENGIHQRGQEGNTWWDRADIGQSVTGKGGGDLIRVAPRIVQWLVRPLQLKQVCPRATINHLAGSRTTDFVQWRRRTVDSVKISHPERSLCWPFG